MKNDNLIYDHFQEKWLNPYVWQPTDTYIKKHNVKRIKSITLDIAIGLAVCVAMAFCSSIVLLTLWR